MEESDIGLYASIYIGLHIDFSISTVPNMICLSISQIKKCAEMARKLRFFRDQIMKAGLPLPVKSTGLATTDVDDLEVKFLLLVLGVRLQV